MNAWFSPEAAQWFSLLAVLSLLAAMGRWVQRGRHETLVIRSFVAAMCLGIVLLAAAVAAFLLDQPSHVLRTLFVTGIVVTVVFAAVLGVVKKGYRDFEQRKIAARDM
jgi:CHASE2 domain-containing sensor protein